MFGTDGIRARVGAGPLALENVLAIGRAVGRLLVDEPSALGVEPRNGTPRRVLVGRDTRGSGPMLERLLVAGLESQGIELVQAGVIPTPGVAHLVSAEGFDLGAVVSASHNPYPDNGLKFFDRRGRKLPREAEEAIERACQRAASTSLPASS